MPKLIRITTVPISLKVLLQDQMKYMKSNGYDVIMVSADGPERKALMEQEDCPHVVVPMTRSITPLQDLRCLWLLIQLFRQEKPDIVHTHTPKAGLLGMLAAKFCSVKVRIHTVAGLPLMTAAGNRKRLLRLMEKLTYWGAQHVLPNSKNLLKYIEEQQLCSKPKLSIIGEGSSNGIDVSRFNPETLQTGVLDKLSESVGIKAHKTYLLTIGRVVRDKGIQELVEAFLELKPKYPNIHLILVGPIEQERAEEGIAPSILNCIHRDPDITHINWSDQVEYLMHLSNLLIHPSHREGFPNVLLQAGAMGLPIVCSNISGNTDAISDGQTGCIFEVKNRENLRDTLAYALDNREKINECALRMQQIVREKYSRKSLHQLILQQYEDYLSNFSKPCTQNDKV